MVEDDSDEEETEGVEGETLLAGDDITAGFHFAGKMVTEMVCSRYGVVGDLTIGGKLAQLPLQGGRTFLEGLDSQSRNKYTWGEMVMAAAMNKILQDKEEAKGCEEREKVSTKGRWEGKAVCEMTKKEEEQLELERELATQREKDLVGSVESYVKSKVEGKAFFFDPTPEHLPEFAKWLGVQMREGNRKSIQRRAIVAVDVLAESTPENLQNIQQIDFLKAGHVWKPKSLALVEDCVLHMEVDYMLMETKPVETKPANEPSLPITVAS